MANKNTKVGGTDWVDGEVLYAADVNDTFDKVIDYAHLSTKIRSGMTVVETGTPDLNVTVASGTYMIAGVNYTYAGGAVASSAAHGASPRIDIMSINAAGTASVTAGTEAAKPAAPGIPANECPICLIYRPASDDTITDDQITHFRSDIVASEYGDWVHVGYKEGTGVDPFSVIMPTDFTLYRLSYDFIPSAAYTIFKMRWNNSSTGDAYRYLYNYETGNNTTATAVPIFTYGSNSIIDTSGDCFIQTNNSTNTVQARFEATIRPLGVDGNGQAIIAVSDHADTAPAYTVEFLCDNSQTFTGRVDIFARYWS